MAPPIARNMQSMLANIRSTSCRAKGGPERRTYAWDLRSTVQGWDTPAGKPESHKVSMRLPLNLPGGNCGCFETIGPNKNHVVSQTKLDFCDEDSLQCLQGDKHKIFSKSDDVGTLDEKMLA